MTNPLQPTVNEYGEVVIHVSADPYFLSAAAARLLGERLIACATEAEKKDRNRMYEREVIAPEVKEVKSDA